MLHIAAISLSNIKLLFDIIKVGIDGWAVVDEQKRKKRQEKREEKIRQLEDRLEKLEKERALGGTVQSLSQSDDG